MLFVTAAMAPSAMKLSSEDSPSYPPLGSHCVRLKAISNPSSSARFTSSTL
ncbi:hypothetical protein D3C80_752950 [compost metagenome]